MDLDIAAEYTGAISWRGFDWARILAAILLQLGTMWLLPRYIEYVLDPGARQNWFLSALGSRMRGVVAGLILSIVSAMLSWLLLYLSVNCPQAPFPTIRGVPYCSQKGQ
jgi:hypothetical protein